MWRRANTIIPVFWQHILDLFTATYFSPANSAKAVLQIPKTSNAKNIISARGKTKTASVKIRQTAAFSTPHASDDRGCSRMTRRLLRVLPANWSIACPCPRRPVAHEHSDWINRNLMDPVHGFAGWGRCSPESLTSAATLRHGTSDSRFAVWRKGKYEPEHASRFDWKRVRDWVLRSWDSRDTVPQSINYYATVLLSR